MATNKKIPLAQKSEGIGVVPALLATLVILLASYFAFLYVVTPTPSAQATLSAEIR